MSCVLMYVGRQMQSHIPYMDYDTASSCICNSLLDCIYNQLLILWPVWNYRLILLSGYLELVVHQMHFASQYHLLSS
jgi:hypothetical protein